MVAANSNNGTGHNPLPPPSKDSAALMLAQAHRGLDSGITHIFRVIAPGQESATAEPIKLLEVNQNTTESGILPVFFSAHPATGLHYPSIIVEVHPSEWLQMQAGQLTLPNGWKVDRAL